MNKGVMALWVTISFCTLLLTVIKINQWVEENRK